MRPTNVLILMAFTLTLFGLVLDTYNKKASYDNCIKHFSEECCKECLVDCEHKK